MSDGFQHYLARVRELIAIMAGSENARLERAARETARCIAGGGIVHLFGSGHSSLLVQEVFHRAGGLVAFNAVLDINLTIFGTSRASVLERLEGYGRSILTSYDIRPGEVAIIVSTSGINPVPIEVAQDAKARGAFTIAVTSAAAYAEAPSRHSSHQRLTGVVDLVLDTHVPAGDAIEPIGDPAILVGASSRSSAPHS